MKSPDVTPNDAQLAEPATEYELPAEKEHNEMNAFEELDALGEVDFDAVLSLEGEWSDSQKPDFRSDSPQTSVAKATEEEKQAVRAEIEKVKEFVNRLKIEDIKSGSWFEKLLAHSLKVYTQKVNAEHFREKYPNRPADAIVQARIDLASRYAMIEGGLTSAAFTGAIAATIGTGGGASPLILPAGGAAFVVDMVYLAQLQLKLTWDIAVLYNVPLNLDDPEDLWKFIKIAFTIKAGETVGNMALKGVPSVIRPFIKKVFTGGTLKALKSLPVVGKYLLQRNIIKFAIPVVSVPLTATVNYWSTKISGRHAARVFRSEARVKEAAQRIMSSTNDHESLLWTIWFAMSANSKTSERQHQMYDLLAEHAQRAGLDQKVLAELRDTIDIDRGAVFAKLAEAQDAEELYKAAITGVALGNVTPRTYEVMEEIANALSLDYNPQAIADSVALWAEQKPKKKKPVRDDGQKRHQRPVGADAKSKPWVSNLGWNRQPKPERESESGVEMEPHTKTYPETHSDPDPQSEAVE